MIKKYNSRFAIFTFASNNAARAVDINVVEANFDKKVQRLSRQDRRDWTGNMNLVVEGFHESLFDSLLYRHRSENQPYVDCQNF